MRRRRREGEGGGEGGGRRIKRREFPHICMSGHKTCDAILPSSSPSFFLSRAAVRGVRMKCHTLHDCAEEETV